MIRPAPRSTLFPYTALFRSDPDGVIRRSLHVHPACEPQGRPPGAPAGGARRERLRLRDERRRSEEHTSELQSRENLVCRLLLEKKKKKHNIRPPNKL